MLLGQVEQDMVEMVGMEVVAQVVLPMDLSQLLQILEVAVAIIKVLVA